MALQENTNLRDQILNACKVTLECERVLMSLAPYFAGICADLRTAIYNEIKFQNNYYSLYISQENEKGGGHYYNGNE